MIFASIFAAKGSLKHAGVDRDCLLGDQPAVVGGEEQREIRGRTKPLLRALKGEALTPPPWWLMRQAGRYLPEYRSIRACRPARSSRVGIAPRVPPRPAPRSETIAGAGAR